MTTELRSKQSKYHSYIKWPAPFRYRTPADQPWRVKDLCAAYNFPSNLPGGGVIGILELGGGWQQSDLDQFSQNNNLPSIQVNDVSVDGTQNSPGSDADGEVALDIQVAAAAYFYATGSMPTINVFWAQNSGGSFTQVINAAVAAGCDVLSISWGSDENGWESTPGQAQAVEAAAAAAANAGMIIFAASGDNSSGDGDPGANVDLPSACPHVIGCGGTYKPRSGAERVWGDGTTNGSGTGGGYSDIFPTQPWQINAPLRNTPGQGGRMVPDVAANADPNTGYLIVVNGQEQQVGGTSAVAPFYAGLFAAFGKKLGWVTPMLWQQQATITNTASRPFVDITIGSNGSYNAGVGPDPCTGLGVPNGSNIYALFARQGSNLQRPTAAAPSNSICSVYAILKPILEVIEATPFFPSNWKTAIKGFLSVMDDICKSTGACHVGAPNATFQARSEAADAQVRLALSAFLQSSAVASAPQALDLGGIATRVCPVYKNLKPILDTIKNFLPGPWSFGIGLAEEVLDQLCGTSPAASSEAKLTCGC